MAQQIDITILTDPIHLGNGPRTPIIENAVQEDLLVQEALEKRGWRVRRINWDHPEMDWTSTRYVLFRSTWDYFNRFREFDQWLERIKDHTQMLNTYETIRWNLDKHYLLELSEKGVHIPPTRFIEEGTRTSLKELIMETGWNEVILKPTISGAARHTYRFTADRSNRYENIFQRLVSQETLMIQEFQNQVLDLGEVSFVLIGGRFTHAMRKKARDGDFRVHEDFGGSLHPYDASDQEIAYAESVVSHCEHTPLYARVDAIWDNRNHLVLSELELIEPELWFRYNPDAAERFADALLMYHAS